MTEPTSNTRCVFRLPDYWTPEQALAVLELLDDLGELICAHYDLKVIDEIRAQHRFDRCGSPDTKSGDDSF